MALDAEDFDFQGLGDKLTNTILDSFDDALGQIKLSSLSTSLVTAFKEVKMSKVIEDSLTKSSEVKSTMKDIQKKLEDGFNQIKFRVGDVIIPALPDQVVKVLADTTNFKLPKATPVEVPVVYKYDKFQQPKVGSITIPVDYKYSKFELPKGQELEVPVSYVYSKFNLPKTEKLEVPVNYIYSKFELPKGQELKVPVSYIFSKFNLPAATKLTVPVDYKYETLTLPKVKELTVPVSFNVDKLQLPKVDGIKVGVKYVYDKFVTPAIKPIQVAVSYVYDKLILPKIETLKVGVSYVYDKFITPVVKAIEVPVKYIYDKFNLPKQQEVPISVNTADAEKQIDLAFRKTTIPISVVPEIAKTTGPTVDTGPFEKVGDLVRQFVNLTQEANKKTTITTELYGRIVSLAEKLVASKRMEKGAVDEIVNTLQNKMEVPPIEVSAKINKVDTSAVDNVLSKPTEIEAKITTAGAIDLSNLEKSFTALMSKLGKQLQTLFKGFDNKKVHIDIPATERIDDLASSYNDVKSVIDEVRGEISDLKKLESGLAAYSKETYSTLQKRLSITSLLEKATRSQLISSAKLLGIENGLKISDKTLQVLITERLVHLQKEKELRDQIVNAAESYNSIIQQIDNSKLTAELAGQLGLIEDEIQTKATLIALDNERVTGVRSLTSEQISVLKAEDQQLAKKKELLNADQNLLSTNKAIVDVNKKLNLSIQTQELTNQLGLLSEEARLKAEAVIQQRLLNGQSAELTSLEKQVLTLLDQEVASARKLAESLSKVGDGQIELNNLIEQSGYDQLVAELSVQKGLTEANIASQAKSLLVAKAAAGQAQVLTDEELTQLQLQNSIVKKARERIEVTQKVIESTNALSKTMQESVALAGAMEDKMYTELGLTQDLTRDKAQAIILDGLRNNLTAAEISKKLEGLKAEDALLQKTRERLNLSRDLETAADEYAKAIRQSDADQRIKSLIVQLNITEDEVAQRARLMSLDNERLGIGKDLTAEQVEQLKHDNHHLRHKRESVELTEQVALYQKKINDQVHHATAEWKKLGATVKAILQNPAFAKGVLTAALVSGIHTATHAMHEFMDMGMQAGEAISGMRKSFSLMALVGLDKSAGVLKNMVQDFGTMNKLTREELHSVGQMAAKMGLTEKEALDVTMAISRMPGQSRETATHFKTTAMQVGKMKGVLPSAIMKEMAKNTASMALYSKGGAEGFAKAAASAKKMGVELSSVLNAAEKTLDFESSINAQMEASVLLGREINMDKLRSAALSGDANAVLQEQQNLLKQAGGLENMNLLQKKKLAEAMGLTVEEMQKMNDEAKFQNEYFGEQAGIFDNITGYALKYGEAIGKGVMSIGPLVASIISLVLQTKMLSIARQQSTVATVKDTASEVNNAASKRLSAAAQAHFSAMQRGGVSATIALANARAMDAAMTTRQTTSNNVGYLSKMKNFVLDKLQTAELAVRSRLVRFFISQKQAETVMENGSYIAKVRNTIANRMAAASERLREMTNNRLLVTMVDATAAENASGLARLRAKATMMLAIAGEKLGLVSKQQLTAMITREATAEQLTDATRKKGLISRAASYVWTGMQSVANFLLIGSNQRVVASEGILEAVRKRGLITGALVYAWQKLRAAGSAIYAAVLNRETASETTNMLSKQKNVLVDSIASNWKKIKTALSFTSSAATNVETGSEVLNTSAKRGGMLATIAFNAVSLVRNTILAAGNVILTLGAGLMSLFGVNTATAGASAGTASGGFVAAGVALGAFGTAAAPAIPIILAIGAALLLATPAIYVLGEVIKSLAVVIGNVLMKALEMLPSIITSVATGFVTIFNTLAANWKILFPLAAGIGLVSLSLFGLAGSLGLLGLTALYAAPGLLIASVVLLAIGKSVQMFGSGIEKASIGIKSLQSSVKDLVPLATGLYAVGKALNSISSSLTKMAVAGIAAMPVIAALKGLTGATAATPTTPAAPAAPGAAPAAAKGTVATITPTPGPAPTSPAATTTPAATTAAAKTETTKRTEPAADMTALMAKIDALIKALPKEVVLKLDGREISKAAMFNLNTSRYPG